MIPSPQNARTPSSSLRRRLSRYAREGRQLRAVFGRDGYRLLAVAEGRRPAILLWTTAPEQFALLRNAALLEWSRILRQLR